MRRIINLLVLAGIFPAGLKSTAVRFQCWNCGSRRRCDKRLEKLLNANPAVGNAVCRWMRFTMENLPAPPAKSSDVDRFGAAGKRARANIGPARAAQVQTILGLF
jgi:hypothetical protein